MGSDAGGRVWVRIFATDAPQAHRGERPPPIAPKPPANETKPSKETKAHLPPDTRTAAEAKKAHRRAAWLQQVGSNRLVDAGVDHVAARPCAAAAVVFHQPHARADERRWRGAPAAGASWTEW